MSRAKFNMDEKETPINLDAVALGDNVGHVLDVHQLRIGSENVKIAADGHTVLIPQPSTDPNDPLNWSPLKKNVILFVISVVAFMPDFASSIGVVTLLPQELQWHKSPTTLQHALAANIFCLGAGGLFSVWLSAYFGRLPILTFFTSMALGTSAWCAAATSFESYMAARILSGFFSIVAQAGGLMFIQDIFFFHEHPRKINVWSGFIIMSPYLGPLCTAFIIDKTNWPVAFWVNTGLTAVCLLLIIGLMDETIYNRTLPRDQQPVPKSRWLRLSGFEQWRNRHSRMTFLQAIMRPVIAVSKLPVALCTVYYFLNFAWIIGVNATISIWLTSIYKFTPYNLGMFYFAPIIGSILGAVLGHWLHDFVALHHSRRHAGRIDPEARLIVTWIATLIMAVSILVLGFALERAWHYMIIAVFMAGQLCGIMIATTALNSYLLDSYPEGSGEVGAWIVVGRTMGGFMATYVEIEWVQRSGLVKVFAVQAAITVAAGSIVAFLQIFGERIRQMQGRMNFPT